MNEVSIAKSEIAVNISQENNIFLNFNKLNVYVYEHSIEALEHLLIVALVYLVVCLSIYHYMFRRRAVGEPLITNLVNNAKFPKFKRVLIVTAHPDDECMFFGPTICALLKRKYCSVYLLCLSNGNFEQKGNTRKDELWKACKVLKIKDENITIVKATNLADDPHAHWKFETISFQILKMVESLDIDGLVTFDREGVSHHPNHCAIYYATASLCLAGLIPNGESNHFRYNIVTWK